MKTNVMKKSPALYIVMFIIWTALAAFLWYNFIVITMGGDRSATGIRFGKAEPPAARFL